MPKLTVYFFGLICHVGEDKGNPKIKKFASLVRDNAHHPFIMEKGQVPIALTTHVTLSSNAAPATADNDFRKHVPSLFELFDVYHDPALIASKSFLFPYPGGDLWVASLYRCKADHVVKGNGVEKRKDKCVARITKLVATNVPVNMELRFNNTAITVVADTEILVSNAAIATATLPPPTCGHGHAMGHINAFQEILDKPLHEIDVVETAAACEEHLEPVPEWVETAIASRPITLADAGGNEGHDGDGGPIMSTGNEGQVVTMTSIHVECGNSDLP